MFRYVVALLLLTPPGAALADEPPAPAVVGAELPDAPSTLLLTRSPPADLFPARPLRRPASASAFSAQLPLSPASREQYQWKSLLLQSFAFNSLLNGVRIVAAPNSDRKLLLNKPFWSDYWASLQQYNMRRWNDGDPFAMNYIGHPVEGAVSGYLEIQNNPRDRALRIGDDRYWASRMRAMLWATVFSTQWEIGPIGEAGIFNQGGFTYPVHCRKNCSHTAQMTNNTGWVDFIVTPTVGTLWIIGEDAIDKYLTDPLVAQHPRSFKCKVIRSSANPSRSLANLLGGRVPWYREYEAPTPYDSYIGHFERAPEPETHQHIDLFPHYSALSVRRNDANCLGCRGTVTGGGLEAGVRLLSYLDFVTDVSVHPHASPLPSPGIGGSLLTGNFGLRTGFVFERVKFRATLAPGFASYSHALNATSPAINPATGRTTNFQAIAALDSDLTLSSHVGLRIGVQNMVIRYKSPTRDPDDIGTPPFLNFLSHDNYVNSTNWGIKLGPVLSF